MATPALVAQNSVPEPPEATPKSREEKRFSRADKDKNGRIEREELLAPRRRKAFAKLDKNRRQAGVRGVGREDGRQIRRRRQGPHRMAQRCGICVHRATSAEEKTLFVLNMS